MTPSRTFEKLKIGKRFVLLDIQIDPIRASESVWDSAGYENKHVPTDVWQLVYRKLGELCKKQFGESGGGSRKEAAKAIVDKEYEYRLEERSNYLIRYEFRDENARDNLNMAFNETEKKLHPGCLSIRITDEGPLLTTMMKEKCKQLEKALRDNEALRMLSASQEYTPAPVKSALSSESHSEYVPTTLNGTSPANHGGYKPSRIEDIVKPEPYTPISSQEGEASNQFSYIPSQVSPLKPERSDDKPIVVSSSGESRRKAATKRSRQTEVDLFGDDDDETDLLVPSSSVSKDAANASDDNMFSEESPRAKELIGSSSDEITTNGRTKLERKTKTKIDYNLVVSPPKQKGSSSQNTGGGPTKRRRKQSVKPGTGMNESLDGWLQKEPRRQKTDCEPSSSKQQSGRTTKEKRAAPKKDVALPKPPPVDHEKLREEQEKLRRNIAGFDALVKMLPEDKSELDVPILNCHDLSVEEMLTTFERYGEELTELHEKYRNRTERAWQSDTDLCYFTEVSFVLTDDQKYAMVQKLEKEFVPEEMSGQYTEWFTSVLIMEWGLRVWMKLHNYTDRQKARDRIKLQEEANPMDCTQSNIDGTPVPRKRR